MSLTATQMGAVGAGVGAGSQLLGGLIGSIMQKRENQRQRDYETQMYERSKTDNLEFWNMSNMYNSPEQQMARLKAAKLNPNLVYGNGANAQVDTLKAPAPNTSNSTNTVNPLGQLDIAGNMSQLYDLKVKDAQANLLNQQALTQESNRKLNSVNEELKRLESLKLRTSNEYDRRSLETRIKSLQLLNDKLITDIANTRSQTRKTDTDRQISVENNNRSRQLHPGNLKLQLADLINKRASTDNLRANTQNTLTKTEREIILKKLDQLDLDYKNATGNYNPDATGISRVIDYITSGVNISFREIMKMLNK